MKSKQKTISARLETRAAILQEASQLSPASQDTVFLGVWSVVDLIARRSTIGLNAQGR